MQSGTPIDRQWISVLKDGRPVLDWGGDLVQDLLSGAFITVEKSEFSHPVRDDELDLLKRAGRVERFDARHVYIYSLPERPQQTME
jgi:ribosomal protein L31